MKYILIVFISFLLATCSGPSKMVKAPETSNDTTTSKPKSVKRPRTTENVMQDSVLFFSMDGAEHTRERIVVLEEMAREAPNFDNDEINAEIMVPENEPRTVSMSSNGRGLASYLIEDVQESKMGEILYHIPDSMRIGKISEVFVRISSVKGTVNITTNITGPVVTNVIKVSETMEVELIDPSLESFKIVQNNKGVQIIDNDSTFTEWRWDVTPLKSGYKSLKLVVSIIRGSQTKQTVYVDSVLVKSNPIYQTEGFFAKYWQWLMSTIVIPFIIWLWKRRKKEKE